MQAACLSWTDQSVCSKLHSTAALAYLTLKQSLCLLPKQKAAKSPSVFFQRCKGIPMHVSNFCLEYIFPPLSCCCKSLVCFGMCHFLFFLRGQRCWVREGQLTQLWDFISGKFQDRSPASSVRVHLSRRRQPLLLQLSGEHTELIYFPSTGASCTCYAATQMLFLLLLNWGVFLPPRFITAALALQGCGIYTSKVWWL